VKRPSKIVCVGRNYVEHAAELGNIVPERPLLFMKPPSALIGHGDEIILPRASDRVEHEAEIGVVVGTTLKSVTEAEAAAGIEGITCINDVTARDLQKQDNQWTRAKGFDTFCPAGPRTVALSALPDLESLEVLCRVNGTERQRGCAADMAFKIPTIVSYISGIMTLEAGDLIATGTPAGVGPLLPGDLVEVEIPGVGVLQNTVASRDR
jgi:2-keto-4-pentenoate hydratase/2-oxohepta-3-ene-1,7-dioic acid hydratase in catechol pathway